MSDSKGLKRVEQQYLRLVTFLAMESGRDIVTMSADDRLKYLDIGMELFEKYGEALLNKNTINILAKEKANDKL